MSSAGWSGMARYFTTLFRIAGSLKHMNYFWNFSYNIFRPWLTMWVTETSESETKDKRGNYIYIPHILKMKQWSQLWEFPWLFCWVTQVTVILYPQHHLPSPHTTQYENQSSKEKAKMQWTPVRVEARNVFIHLWRKKAKQSKQLSYILLFQGPPLTLGDNSSCKRNERQKKRCRMELEEREKESKIGE